MLNDQQLLIAFSNGDASGMDTLIALYEDDLFNLCCKLAQSRPDAEDLYQQTWLKVVQYAHTYTNKSFKNWLYTLCLNTYRDSYRKNKRRQNISGPGSNTEARDYALAAATDHVSAENAALDEMAQKALVSCIDRLNDKLRLPILLCYFEGLDYKETAQALHVPVGTVKSRLNAAKNRLREEMEKETHA